MKKVSDKQKERNLLIKKIYNEISEEREHECESCLTSKNLSHSHIIPKSRRKDLEITKKNIIYQCISCHFEWENGSDKRRLINYDKMMEYINSVDSEYYNLLKSKS